MSEGKKEILLGDCLELMKDIPNGSIDMILCDLPYGTTKCKWDVIIPFDLLWKQYNRIIKDNGAIILFGVEPFSSALRMSNLKYYRYDWVWNKKKATNFLFMNKQPGKLTENICVFYKKQPTYNPQKTINKKISPPRRFGRRNGYATELYGNMPTDGVGKNYEPDKKLPTNILDYYREDKRIHPTQKPVALFEYLIKTYTNEGETVLDNCAGSGTTAIACLNTNRQFIVMEKEQKYYDIILKRVADFNKNFEPQTLFGNEM